MTLIYLSINLLLLSILVLLSLSHTKFIFGNKWMLGWSWTLEMLNEKLEQ